MSINQNVLGLIFASINDSAVIDLTKLRTMGSIPYGGRYRMVDFILSSMVNCGIGNVSIIVRKNYHSLMDHLGSGREWDLARKKRRLKHCSALFREENSGVLRKSGSTGKCSRFPEMAERKIRCYGRYQHCLQF
mgnify:CR=1 FL=1